MFEQLRLRLCFGRKVRLRLWRKLAVQIQHKVPMYLAIEQYAKRAAQKHDYKAHIYAKMLHARDTGKSLASSLYGLASSEELMLIQAGEAAGNLENGFRLSSELLQNRGVIAQSIRSALIYPTFLLLLVIAMLLMISRMIIPQLAIVFDPLEWTGTAALLYTLATFVNSPLGALCLALFLIGLGLMFFSFSRWTGAIRKKLDGFGPWAIYRTMVGSNWLFSLAVLMQAGLQIRFILEEMLRNPQTSPYLHERVLAIARQYALGKNLGDALYDCGYAFPSEESVDDLQTYALLPEMEQHLFSIAREQMVFDLESIQARMKVLNISLLLLVFALILFTLAGVYSFQQQFAAIV